MWWLPLLTSCHTSSWRSGTNLCFWSYHQTVTITVDWKFLLWFSFFICFSKINSRYFFSPNTSSNEHCPSPQLVCFVCAQSCQPLCFGHSLLPLRALHYTATLMIISLRWPPKNKNKIFLISCMCVGIKHASNQLCVCLFCVCSVGCATANRCACFKPADQL